MADSKRLLPERSYHENPFILRSCLEKSDGLGHNQTIGKKSENVSLQVFKGPPAL